MSKTKMPQEDIEFVKNVLRQGSVKWSGRAECLRLARKKVFVRMSKKGKKIFKLHWKCAHCNKWYRDETDLEVDHIIEIGTFSGDWNDYMEKLFARPVSDKLQALCKYCHMKKTKKYNSANSLWERKKPQG